MNRYHCPYCPVRYQFPKERSDGIIICGQCGDPLVKSPLIKPVQFLALIAASAFITPMIVLIISTLKEQSIDYPQKDSWAIHKVRKSLD
tara:strand:- start:788 stop:1054 length:267 start_codon:yes stop_codon:yes gene_type:complete